MGRIPASGAKKSTIRSCRVFDPELLTIMRSRKRFRLHARPTAIVITHWRTLMRQIVLCAVLVLAVSFAQPPAPPTEGPRFEVVAIKPIPAPTPGDGTPYGLSVNGARVQGVNQLFGLLTRGFRV